MASGIYLSHKRGVFDNGTNLRVDWDADTVKLALLDSGHTPDFDTHNFFDDVEADEVSGTGYTGGGATLASVTITPDTTNDRVDVDATDVSWTTSTITARYGVLYKSTGTSSTSPLIALIDFTEDKISTAGTFLVQWNASGIVRLA